MYEYVFEYMYIYFAYSMRACIVDIPTHATHQRQPSKVDNLKDEKTTTKE